MVNRPAFVFATSCKAADPAPIERPISRHHLTRQPPYHRDILSRLALPYELIEYRSPCGIKSLAGGGRSAPMLLRQLA